MAPSLKTKTLILSPAVLAQSPYLPAISQLINYSYKRALADAGKGGLLPPDSTKRLRSPTQLCSELETDSFTMLIFSPDLTCNELTDGHMTDFEYGALVATASARPYAPGWLRGETDGDEMNLLFKRPYPTREDNEPWAKWEVLAMAVHPSLQHRGLGEQLEDQMTAEIKSRAFASISYPAPQLNSQDSFDNGEYPESTTKVAKKKLMIVGTVVRELNESRYHKKGYTTIGIERFEPGTMGSRDGFSVAKIMKWIDCDGNDKEEGDRLSEVREGAGMRYKGSKLAKL